MDGRLSSSSHGHCFQNLHSFPADTVINLQVATLETPETSEMLEIQCCFLSDIFTSLLSVKLIWFIHITPQEKQVSNRAQKDLMGAKGQFPASPIIYFPQGFLCSVLSTTRFAKSRFSSFETGKNQFITEFFWRKLCAEKKQVLNTKLRHSKHIISALINTSCLLNSSLVKRSHLIHLPLKTQ